MKTTLILPDGSAYDGSMVAAIRWTKAREGQYGCQARVVVDIYKEPDLLMGFGARRAIGDGHSVDMESNEAAESACRALVGAWTGRAFEAATTG